MKNPIYPCLWFENQAKAAAEFYCAVFPNSKIIDDTPMVVTFELNGRKFMGLNAGPEFKFTEAISFVIECKDQQEIDSYWNKLSEGGAEGQCGWLKDKFGLSWQVIPANMGELVSDPSKGQRVFDALMRMKKIDVKKLENA